MQLCVDDLTVPEGLCPAVLSLQHQTHSRAVALNCQGQKSLAFLQAASRAWARHTSIGLSAFLNVLKLLPFRYVERAARNGVPQQAAMFSFRKPVCSRLPLGGHAHHNTSNFFPLNCYLPCSGLSASQQHFSSPLKHHLELHHVRKNCHFTSLLLTTPHPLKQTPADEQRLSPSKS